MAVRPLAQLPQLIPMVIAIVIAGSNAPVFGLGLTVVALIAVSVVPWATTFYQVTDTHVRLRTGVLNKKVATARRDRIRSVDLTASAPHRVLGLKKVLIGTGSDGNQVELNCVAAPYAQALHSSLMPTGTTADAGATVDDQVPPQVLARFRPDWLRYAPFSLGGLAVAAAIGAFGAQFANELGAFDRLRRTGDTLLGWIDDAPLGLVVAVAVVGVVVLAAVLSVVGYLLGNWGFTLTRHPDATLRVSRGLINTAETSLDEKRVRGVHLHEPILMRPVRGARLFAIATGSSRHPMLLPPAPLDDAVAVAAEVADSTADLSAPLADHGPGARRRRISRAVMSAVVVAAVPLAAAGFGWASAELAVTAAVVLAAAALLAALPRIAHLGSAVTDTSVVVSSPTIARHRYLVGRGGVVGWSWSSSPFQRRLRVATLTLATAAGSQAYEMVDLPDARAVSVMATVSPDLVRPFLVDPGAADLSGVHAQ